MTMVEVIEKEITEDIERMADDLPLHRFVAAGNRNLMSVWIPITLSSKI